MRRSSTQLTRTVRFSGVGLMFVILASVEALVAGRPPCTNDPCWHLWLYWVFRAVKGPLGLAMIAAGLAWWYQRRNKIMEFQFQVYREAVRAYSDLCQAAQDIIRRKMLLLASQKMPPLNPEAIREAAADIERQTGEFDSTYIAAERVLEIMPTLYSKHVQESWAATIDRLGSVNLEDDVESNRRAVLDSGESMKEFRNAAAKEIPLPYKVGRLYDPEEAKRARERMDRILRWLKTPGASGPPPR